MVRLSLLAAFYRLSKTKRAFSLLECLISLALLGMIAAAFAPLSKHSSLSAFGIKDELALDFKQAIDLIKNDKGETALNFYTTHGLPHTRPILAGGKRSVNMKIFNVELFGVSKASGW